MVATISFWDSYQFRQDLKSWRRRHGLADTCGPQRVRIASVLQNLRRCLTPPSILNGERTKNTNKNATSHFVKVFFFSFLLPFRGTLRKKCGRLFGKCHLLSLCGLVRTSESISFLFFLLLFFFQTLNSSVWNKTVDIHLLQRMRLVIHKLAVRPAQTHKRPICGAIITSTTTSPDKTIRPSVL